MYVLGLSILMVSALLTVLFSWKRAGGMVLLMMVFLSLAMYWSFSVIGSDGAKYWLSPGVLLWIAGFACFARTRFIGRVSQP